MTATTKFCSSRENNVLSGKWFCYFPISKPLTLASFHDVVRPCYRVSVSFPFRYGDQLVKRAGKPLFASAFSFCVFDQFSLYLFDFRLCLRRCGSATRANGNSRRINGVTIQALAARRCRCAVALSASLHSAVKRPGAFFFRKAVLHAVPDVIENDRFFFSRVWS